MKKQLALATAALMALSLAACGSTATASSAAESTSTAASSEAASTDSTAADDGDVLQQAAAAAFANDVTLTMWGAEEDQELLRTIADNFIKEYGNYGGKITINLGAQSEKEAKDTVLTDPTAAADVYAFADDQLNELVQAGALQEVQLNADDIKSRNTAASVDAATLNGKLYAYPLTADNGYFMFYDKSFFTEDDVKSLDTMMEKAAAAGKKVSMDVANGWYLYSFYAGAGLNLNLADDGVNTVCNWNILILAPYRMYPVHWKSLLTVHCFARKPLKMAGLNNKMQALNTLPHSWVWNRGCVLSMPVPVQVAKHCIWLR